MVDRLEQRLEGRARLARVNVFNPEADPVMERYRVSVTPTYLVVNARGDVLYRQSGGNPDNDRILTVVQKAKR